MATLRRRNVDAAALSQPSNGMDMSNDYRSSKTVVKKLDLFPKVDTEYTVKTDGGGIASIVAYVLIFVLIGAECVAWVSQNNKTSEHLSVEKSLGKRMRVNLNITFPALACEDVHIDVMDVAGDSQINVEDTMVKQRLSLRGIPMSSAEKAESNKHRLEQEKKEKLLEKDLPDDYWYVPMEVYIVRCQDFVFDFLFGRLKQTNAFSVLFLFIFNSTTKVGLATARMTKIKNVAKPAIN